MQLFSVRKILGVSLVLLALVPTVLVGLLLLHASSRAAEDMAGSILTHVADRVQISSEDHLLQAHKVLNALTSPKPSPSEAAVIRGWLHDTTAFETMAFALMRQSPHISALYISDARGNYLGVEPTSVGVKVGVHLPTDKGCSFYLAQHPGDRSRFLNAETSSYDPCMRVWYKDAERAGERVFSPVEMSERQQLIVRLSQPVQGLHGEVAGVLGVDLQLQPLADALRVQRISSHGAAFVVDENLALVASSAGDVLLTHGGSDYQRVSPRDSANPVIRTSFAALTDLLAQRPPDVMSSDTRLQRLPSAQGTLLMVQRPFAEALGLRWTLVVVVPESDFTSDIQQAWHVSLGLIVALALLGVQFAWLLTRSISSQLQQLSDAAGSMGRGEVPVVDQLTHIDEVRELSQVLHDSARQLQSYQAQVKANALELQRSNETLETRVAERTAELAASREEALAAVRAKAAFLATMSHEIRTPLNGVVGMTALLAETPLDPEQRDYLQTVRLSSDQLLAVINDVLDFSKIESGKLHLEVEPLSLRGAVEEACDIAAPRARDKGLELIIDMPEVGEDRFPAAVLGDVTRLRQVLINLVNNAVKFTQHGDVTVSVRLLHLDPPHEVPANATLGTSLQALHGAVELEFRVTDTGIGIPADRQPSLFEAFSQVDASTTRKYGGSGLGLAICRRLVKMMGGSIGVSSQPGQGSSFWFTLRAPLSDSAPSASNLAGVELLRGTQVLVVDDHPTNVRILKRQLERWGMQVTAVESGVQALEQLRRTDLLPDLIITDMHMPDMDGMELARILREHLHWHVIPLVLLSSGFMPSGSDMGRLFDARLLKPVRQAQLCETLARCISANFEVMETIDPVLADPKKNVTILVADDNAINLKVACAMLRKLGYDISTAVDGREAVVAVARSMARHQPFGAILMDVNMPDVDGLEATRQILSAWGAKAPPIIALTAAALPEDRLRCEAAGMVDYLTKPLQVVTLSQKLDQWLSVRASVFETHALLQDSSRALHTADSTGVTLTLHSGPVMDFGRLEEFREFDDEQQTMIHEVVGLFLSDGPKRLAAIEAAAQANDPVTLSLAAHALKGAASNIGAIAVQAQCTEIEQQAKRGMPDDSAASLLRLQATWTRTKDALQAWL